MRRPRRTAAFVIAGLVAAGLVAVLIAGASLKSDAVASVGVPPTYPVAPILPGARACQSPMGVTESFDRVHFNVGTFGRPGPPLTVSILDEASNDEIGWGTVQPGWVDDGSAKDVSVGTIEPGVQVGVCIRNDGSIPAYVYGDFYHGVFGKGPLGVTPTNSTNSANVDGDPLEGDMAIDLRSGQSRSLLERLPAVLDHAGAYKPPFVGAWTFWLLAVLVLVGAPLALWAALSRAADATQAPEGPRYPDSPRP
jgi:hypothetical protein